MRYSRLGQFDAILGIIFKLAVGTVGRSTHLKTVLFAKQMMCVRVNVIAKKEVRKSERARSGKTLRNTIHLIYLWLINRTF